MTSPLIRNQQETIKPTEEDQNQTFKTTSKSPTLQSMRNHDQSQQEKRQDPPNRQELQKAEQERDHQ